jgi:glycerate-2-kinase
VRDPRVAQLVRGSLAACAPREATARALRARSLREPLTILAFGKCAAEMMRGALDLVVAREAMLVTGPGRHEDLAARGVIVRIAAHPEPSGDAPTHGREALALAARAAPEGTLLVLASGGGSSMLELPAVGLSIQMITHITRTLMLGGADITSLNVVRAALSSIKGGRLAAASRADVVTLVAEDVPGRPELVASGPTVPFSTRDARAILAQHGIAIDEALGAALSRPAVALERAPSVVTVVGNDAARRGVIEAASRLGIVMEDLGASLRGEAREAGARLVRAARDRAVVIGGETTVTVRGGGRGGRNQELVLGAFLARPSGLVASLGTDGIDGASQHAGAYLDEASWAHARRNGRDAERALIENDSASYFADLGTAIVTGPTGSNAADVAWVLPREPGHEDVA